MTKNERRAQLRNKKRKYIRDYLCEHPCEVCWETRPVCLEFHHIDPDGKSFEPWMSAWIDMSIKRLQNEINKCQVLCANCHRVETAKQQKRYSFLNLPEFNETIDWPMMSS